MRPILFWKEIGGDTVAVFFDRVAYNVRLY